MRTWELPPLDPENPPSEEVRERIRAFEEPLEAMFPTPDRHQERDFRLDADGRLVEVLDEAAFLAFKSFIEGRNQPPLDPNSV